LAGVVGRGFAAEHGGTRCAWAAYEKLEFVWRNEVALVVR